MKKRHPAQRRATAATRRRVPDRRYRQVVEDLTEVVSRFRADGTYTFVNTVFCRFFGRTRASLIGRKWHPLALAEDLPRIEEQLRALSPAHPVVVIENRVYSGRGEVRWMQFVNRAFFDARGRLVETLSVGRDITERQQAEAARRQSDERLGQVLEAVNDGVWDWDLRTGAAYLNPRYYEMTGYRPDEVVPGLAFFQRLVHPEDLPLVMKTIDDHFQGRTGQSEIEYRMITRQGEVKWILGRGRVVDRDTAGKPLRMLGTITDIGARKQAEDALRALTLQLSRAEADERSRIARDLHDATGQKLAALSMSVGLLRSLAPMSRRKSDRLLADCLTMIEECAQEVRTLSYLLHPPLLDELGLAAAIRAYVGGFTKRSGQQVAFEGPRGAQRLPAEVEIALFRIVQECLGNIHRHAAGSTARIQLAVGAERVTLEVADRGSGLSARKRKAIAAGRGDTGVGIAGMRERLRLLGGRLEIVSEGQGTTIRAIVPHRKPHL